MAFNRTGFINEATQAGKSPEEINSFLQSKGEAPQAEQPQQNILQKIGGFLAPVATKTAQIAGGALGLRSKAAQEAEESQRRAEEMNRLLIGRAGTAPADERERMLGVSRSISGSLGQLSQERLAGAEAIPVDTETWSPVKQGAGTALELGALLAPGIGAKGLQVTKGTSILKGLAGKGIEKAVARGAITGAPIAGLTALAHTLSEDERVEIGEVVGRSLLGGVLGGTVAGGFALGGQMFKKFTDFLPVVKRRIGLKIPIKETQTALEQADELARETLAKGKYGTMAEEISGGKFEGTPPGSYKGLKKWLGDMFNIADDEIKRKTVDTKFTIDDVVAGDYQATFRKNLETFQKELGARLEFEGGKGEPIVFKAERFKPIIKSLLDGESVSFNDLNKLRSALDLSRQATFRATEKSGASLSAKSGDKLVSMINTAHLLRDSLRHKSPDGVAALFDMESFSLSFLSKMDRAIASYQASLLPSRWETTIIAGAAGMGGAPFAGPAALGTAAYRLPQLPGVQKFLYGAGQAGQKIAPAVSGLEKLLGKGAAVGAGRL